MPDVAPTMIAFGIVFRFSMSGDGIRLFLSQSIVLKSVASRRKPWEFRTNKCQKACAVDLALFDKREVGALSSGNGLDLRRWIAILFAF